MNLASEYFKKKDYRNSISQIEIEIESNPANYDAKVFLGICYVRLGEFETASDHLHRVLSYNLNDKTSLRAYYALGELYFQRKQDVSDYTEAFKYFEAALFLAYRVNQNSVPNILYYKSASLWMIHKNEDYYEYWSGGLFARERTVEVGYRDIKKAIELSVNEVPNFYYLAYRYAEGLNDHDKINYYLEKAAALGQPNALSILKDLKEGQI